MSIQEGAKYLEKPQMGRGILLGGVPGKIGTYGLALLAKAHNVPFFIAAPSSTFDLTLQSGDEIPIEERSIEEVLRYVTLREN